MPKLAVTEGSGKRVAILARVTPTVRESLEVAAGASGRSLSLEIETRLQASFDLSGQAVLQDEIKTEMRVTIAALEDQIAVIKKHDALLWPDESARALGHIFALTLSSVRHAGGKDWRDDPAAPVIIAGVVRRLMDRCSRKGGSFASEWFDRERIASTTEAVTATLANFVDSFMPPLPPLQPQDDPANRTHRARNVVTLRDKTTGKLLQAISTAEYDIIDPDDWPSFGPEYRAALDRFHPNRDTVDVEDFVVHWLKDRSTVWDSLTKPGTRIAVPAGQDVPPEPLPETDPGPHLVGAVKAATKFEPVRGQLDPSIGDKALFDEARGPARDGDATPPDPVAPAAPAASRRKVKAKA